jgi:hypothetical protein
MLVKVRCRADKNHDVQQEEDRRAIREDADVAVIVAAKESRERGMISGMNADGQLFSHHHTQSRIRLVLHEANRDLKRPRTVASAKTLAR